MRNGGTVYAEIGNPERRHSGSADAMMRRSRVFALLGHDREANSEKPKRQNERTLKHGGTQSQIAANASKNFAQKEVAN
jgi:hypothetical protein